LPSLTLKRGGGAPKNRCAPPTPPLRGAEGRWLRSNALFEAALKDLEQPDGDDDEPRQRAAGDLLTPEEQAEAALRLLPTEEKRRRQRQAERAVSCTCWLGPPGGQMVVRGRGSIPRGRAAAGPPLRAPAVAKLLNVAAPVSSEPPPPPPRPASHPPLACAHPSCALAPPLLSPLLPPRPLHFGR